MDDTAQKTFFVTGVSGGLGRALLEVAVAQGHRVIGTVRSEAAKSEIDAIAQGRSFGRVLDIRDEAAVDRVVQEVEASIGGIDVLVNNAGYGHEGTVEESPMEELRQQFEVNVFGAMAVTKAVLPFMRARRKGHILNITSMGGRTTMPGIAYYNGSKFALEGLSGSLGKEVKPFGIAVTAVEPGGFRTDWAGRSMVRTTRKIADYDAVFDPLRDARKKRDGNQSGDPVKAAQAMLKVVESANPPSRLLLGPDALGLVRAELDAQRQEIDAWESLTLSTNFDV